MDYADTLGHGRVRVIDGAITLTRIQAGEADIILDRTGFFPVKLSNRVLTAGRSRVDERILLYESGTPIPVPGELGFTLKDGVDLDRASRLYRVLDGVRVRRAPASTYQLRVPVTHGVRRASRTVERLCRSLVRSPDVADARPLVNLTTVYPGL